MTAKLQALAWVPYSKEVVREAKENYELRLYNEKQCGRCEYLSERHTDVCDTCPAFEGHYKLWRKSADGERIGLPTGDRRRLKAVAGKQKYKDLRGRTPMVHNIKFTAELRGKQQEAVDMMIEKGYGLLQAPPRSGKTVMGTAVICIRGQKALILADQYEFLDGFHDTFCGNKTNDIKPFTNINRFGGSGQVIGFCKTFEDFEKYDVCLATYQTFLSPKGQALLKRICRMFGTVIIDEAHKVAAKCFLRVVNKFSAKCRIGLTGTPDRKDKKNVLTELVLGPPVYVMEVQTMVPRVIMMPTTAKPPRPYKVWTYFEKFLVEDADRNRLIVKTAVEDLKAGRSIVIPVTRVHHAIALAKAINKVMRENVATHFIGSQSKTERKTIIEKARNGDLMCVVGIRKLVQLGINVPRWDMLYEVMPISNPPNFEQESSRVRTPMDGKPQPVVRHFIDDIPQSRGCLRTCYWQGYKPWGFVFHARDKQIIDSYMRNGPVEAPKGPVRF